MIRLTFTRRLFVPFTLLGTLLAANNPVAGDDPTRTARPFVIRVLDDETGRGVPLVELRTVHGQRFVTDSAGVVAFAEPGFFGEEVFLHVRAHGYEYPADGFGYRGARVRVVEGGRTELRIKRVNIAERLFRLTGAGIYRDSALAGEPIPPNGSPGLSNGKVLGSDSVTVAEYKGRLHWFWGDTNLPRYPLGLFHMAGAVTPPGAELDPDLPIPYRYFVNERGEARATAELPGPGPTWVSGVVVVPDPVDGRERLFGHYIKVKPPMEAYEWGVVEWNDAEERFVKAVQFPKSEPFPHGAHPVLHDDGRLYYADPYPRYRVANRPDALLDQSALEGYTCLLPPSPDAPADAPPRVERDASGRAVWRWRPGVRALEPAEQAKLIRDGVLKPDEGWMNLRDVETGEPVLAHRGSVAWNPHRRRHIMIFGQSFGSSLLGEIWYAEADGLMGPWDAARKIVTHDRYSFYNPKHHPFLDREGGRVIHFEGTYTQSFSGNPEATPLYDYNQILYRLRLDDPRLGLAPPAAD